MPNELDSSTANNSLSKSISNDVYGGRSKRLKQVCALKQDKNILNNNHYSNMIEITEVS